MAREDGGLQMPPEDRGTVVVVERPSLWRRILPIIGFKKTSDAAGERKAGIATRLGFFLPLSMWIVLMIFFTFMSDSFLTTGNMMNLIRQSSVLLVAGLSATIIILMGSIDLAVGTMMTLCAISAAILIGYFGEGAIFIVLLIGVVGGLISGWLCAYAKLPSFLVTLGLLYVWQGAGLLAAGGHPWTLRAPTLSSIMGGDIGGIPKIGVWALVIMIIISLIARYTRFGRYLTAIGDGERVAVMSGVPVKRVKLMAFALAGLLAAIGGLLLVVRMNSGAPGIGDGYLLDAIAVTVLGGTALSGGVGGPSRTIFGVLVIVTLTNGMIITGVNSFAQIAIRGAVVILAVAMTISRGGHKGVVIK